MRQGYKTALSICYVFTKTEYRDLRHDAFIRWHRQTGRNLFEERNGQIYMTIKRTFLDNLKKIYNPQRHTIKPQFSEIEEDTSSLKPNNPSQFLDYTTPYNTLVTKEEAKRIISQLSDWEGRIIDTTIVAPK